jgi:hypothetical protein
MFLLQSLKVISVLNNENYITAMVYLNDGTVWVADANGWITIWHMVYRSISFSLSFYFLCISISFSPPETNVC